MALCTYCQTNNKKECELQKKWNENEASFKRALARIRQDFANRDYAASHADLKSDFIATLRAQRREGIATFKGLQEQFGCEKLKISDTAE